jgi:hypothetical protein
MLHAANDESIPAHVESEVNRYLKCGILQHGFVLLECLSCGANKVVAYSCRCRGFCKFCGNKRMEQLSRRIEGEVWPEASARQFVLTFPHQVRHWLARNPELLSAVVAVVNGVISHFYELQTLGLKESELHPERASGSITFVQHFKSSLSRSPHLHILFLDGVFVRGKGTTKEFKEYPNFDSSCVILILRGIHEHLSRLFKDWGYVSRDGEPQDTSEFEQDLPAPLKVREPKAYRRSDKTGLAPHPLFKQTDPEMMSVEGWCLVKWRWFSLHAAVAVKGTGIEFKFLNVQI